MLIYIFFIAYYFFASWEISWHIAGILPLFILFFVSISLTLWLRVCVCAEREWESWGKKAHSANNESYSHSLPAQEQIQPFWLKLSDISVPSMVLSSRSVSQQNDSCWRSSSTTTKLVWLSGATLEMELSPESACA